MKTNAFLKFAAIAASITILFSSCKQDELITLDEVCTIENSGDCTKQGKEEFDNLETYLLSDLESEAAKSNQVRKVSVKNNGWYEARCYIHYKVNGQKMTQTIDKILLGQTKGRDLPHNATGIKITGYAKTQPVAGKPVGEPQQLDNRPMEQKTMFTGFQRPLDPQWKVIGARDIALNDPNCDKFNVTFSGTTTMRKCKVKGCNQTFYPK